MYIINSTILIVWQANTPDLITTDFSMEKKKKTHILQIIWIFSWKSLKTHLYWDLHMEKKTCARFVQKYQTNYDCEKYIIPLIKHMNDSFSKGGQQALDFL